MQRSNSHAASSGACKGTLPSPTKRSGFFATISAMPSFSRRSIARLCSAGAQYVYWLMPLGVST